MYDGIRYDVWMLLFLAFVIYALTFYHGQRLLRGKMNPRAVWTVISAFIDQDNFSINWNDEKHSRFFILWSLVMSIGLFFSTNYLNNCACTDLVVYTKPWAPVSYQVSRIFLFHTLIFWFATYWLLLLVIYLYLFSICCVLW